MQPFVNIHLRTVNQRVLGSSPRGGAQLDKAFTEM